MKRSPKHKRSDYSEDSKSKQSRYNDKKRSGCEINHARHENPVAWCEKCIKEKRV